MTIQTAVLIETLQALGATVRWSSCNIFSTQDHAAVGRCRGRRAGVRLEGHERGGVLVVHRTDGARARTDWTPNMILDDGGDLTLLMHQKYPDMLKDVRGISEETTTGVHRLRDMATRRQAADAGDQRQRQRDQVQVRQPLRLPGIAGRRHPPRHRRDDGRQGRRGERLRRRRQGLGRVAAQCRLPRDGHRGRPDLRLAGGDGRLSGRSRWTMPRRSATSSSPRPATST